MLAIVIPYYKLIFFGKTLQSLANQTDKRFRVYIGDDASPDDCKELLQEFKGQFDFEYLRFENNLGGSSLTQHWERCIALTKGENWLMVLGDDDVLGNNCVEAFYQNLNLVEANRSNVVRFACNVINAENTVFLGPYLHPQLESAADFYCRKVSNLTRSSLSEYIFKREMYEKYNFTNYPLAWYSDDKAWIDFSENKPIVSINEALVSVRISDMNISGRTDNIEQKLTANFQFFSDIIQPKGNIFSKGQTLFLLLAFEQIVKKERKLKMHEWKMLFRNYIFYFRIIPILKLTRRFLISIFDKCKKSR